jgi:hypothetical protein
MAGEGGAIFLREDWASEYEIWLLCRYKALKIMLIYYYSDNFYPISAAWKAFARREVSPK